MDYPIGNGALQMFDVDHGQCALLTIPNGFGGCYRALIDCGHAVNFRGGPWYPGEHLQSMGITYIDLMVCTNFDEDHMSGFPDLDSRGITIGCILGNPTVPGSTIVKLKTANGQNNLGRGIEAVALALSIRQSIGWKQEPPLIPGVNMVWTYNTYPLFEDENNLSMVFTLDVHGYRFMFPGDMECAGWRNLLTHCEAFRPLVAGVGVLMASHHGRESGICPELFDTYGCRPKLMVISDDYKQYATQETSEYYASKATGIAGFRNERRVRRVLTTRKDGPITFHFLNDGCIVN